MTESNGTALRQASVLVVCLCAQWCGVCRDYQVRFEQVQAAITSDHAGASFLWIDVEDEADLLHPLDVEDFPTLLIAVDGSARFFGPLTPQAQTLERMVRVLANDVATPALPDQPLQALVQRIAARYLGPIAKT